MADLGRGAKGLAALGILAAGIAAGALAERLATRRLQQREFVGIESATGVTREVITDDGVALRVVEETDDVPSGAPTVRATATGPTLTGPGSTADWTVPAAWLADINSGVAGGFGLVGTSTYMRISGPRFRALATWEDG